MPTRTPLNISGALQYIATSLEHALSQQKRCYILHEVFNKWPPDVLSLLENKGVIRKEQSRRLEEINCFCGGGKKLTVQYEDNKSRPYAQCFECSDLRPVDLAELEYYESSPLHLASFAVQCIGNIDKPRSIINDKLFFVGEASAARSVYFACGLMSFENKEIIEACKKDAGGSAFILISTFIPANIAKQYTVLSSYESRLYTITDSAVSLDVAFIESHFRKRSQQQEAAFAKHVNDPRTKQRQQLHDHIMKNIDSWPTMNHEEIHQHICGSPMLYEYETKAREVKKLSDKTMLTVIKDILTQRDQRFRITGTPEYNDDRLAWYFKA